MCALYKKREVCPLDHCSSSKLASSTYKAGMSTIGHCGGFKSFDVCIHMPIHIYNIHIHTYIHYTLYIPLAVAPVRL